MSDGQGGSLVRALRVLEAVSALGDGVTAKAVARRLGCPLPTAYRTLGTLVEEGYLVRLHEVRGYGLGYKVAELHRGLVGQVRPAPAVQSAMHRVHEEAGAAAYLAVLRDDVVVVAHVDLCAEHPGRLGLRVGEPAPPHATALGRALLADMTAATVTAIVGSGGLPAFTPRTVAHRSGLDRELHRVRSSGAAIAVEELHQGVAEIAVGAGRVAVGVAVPRADFTARRTELEAAVRRGADRVTSALPASPAP
jgi:IclR family transcriptional regulator, acetate operon repressor